MMPDYDEWVKGKEPETGATVADARRLVACWKAMEGVPTEWIEGYVANGVKNLVQDNADLVKERNELLNVVRLVCKDVSSTLSQDTEIAIFNILAKYPGE